MKLNQIITKHGILGMMLTVIITASTLNVKAEEGMWIPMLLEKYNIEAMQEAG